MGKDLTRSTGADKITWSEHLSVHIAALDEQHKAIFEAINTLATALPGGDQNTLLAHCNAVIELSEQHFAAEETLLERTGYLGLAKQRRDHAAFITRLRQFRSELPTAPTSVSTRLADFAASWLTAHLEGADAAYCEFLRDQGIS